MQIRTYTERSNARRAAKAAGVDPALVFATDDGFTFPAPAEEARTAATIRLTLRPTLAKFPPSFAAIR